MNTRKKMTNKRLVNYLMQRKDLVMISIDKRFVVCTCAPKFNPSAIKEIVAETGHEQLKLTVDGDTNYIIFTRFE